MIEKKNVNKEEVLIIKADKGKQKLKIKLRKRMKKGYSPDSYFKVLNPRDYNDLAIFLEDLDLVIGAPVEKAFHKYKQNKGEGFPFF